MSPEAQRIAIGEACGLSRDSLGPDFDKLPDYLNDLNAMHEAEKKLTDAQYERFSADVWAVVNPGEIRQPSHPVRLERAFLSANAAQRAEAFLCTLGLWLDDQNL